MKVLITGQQDFGRAALEAFHQRGDTIVGVCCAPEKPGARPDPLKELALELGLTVIQRSGLGDAEVLEQIRALAPDLGVMAYVLQFAPQAFVDIPRWGTIQYHPSLLPRYRGPSSINWPIIRGDVETGLTIFRPSDGLDEGPILLQKRVAIGADDTLGSVYFNHLFPKGIEALLEVADLIAAGRHTESHQDEALATYEGWCRAPAARIDWHHHVDLVYNLIRGCNPAPGAWTSLNGETLQIFDAERIGFKTFGAVKGKIGALSEITERGFRITAQGGQIEVLRVKFGPGKKIDALTLCQEQGLAEGTPFGA